MSRNVHQNGTGCQIRPEAATPASPRVRSLAEIIATPPRKLRHGQRWGAWQLDAERLTLDYKPEGIWRYELDLERVWDSASLLDWLFQIRGKGWATPTVLADLLNAIQDVFDPQRNLCSAGQHKRLPAGFLAGRVEAASSEERQR